MRRQLLTPTQHQNQMRPTALPWMAPRTLLATERNDATLHPARLHTCEPPRQHRGRSLANRPPQAETVPPRFALVGRLGVKYRASVIRVGRTRSNQPLRRHGARRHRAEVDRVGTGAYPVWVGRRTTDAWLAETVISAAATAENVLPFESARTSGRRGRERPIIVSCLVGVSTDVRRSKCEQALADGDRNANEFVRVAVDASVAVSAREAETLPVVSKIRPADPYPGRSIRRRHGRRAPLARTLRCRQRRTLRAPAKPNTARRVTRARRAGV